MEKFLISQAKYFKDNGLNIIKASGEYQKFINWKSKIKSIMYKLKIIKEEF